MPGELSVASAEPPLVVDLDGTLLRSDLLIESALLFARATPHRLPQVLRWLADGKARLKAGLAAAADIDARALPYDAEVLALIESARAEGRSVVLATASHRSLAERVAAHLALFDAVVATDGALNLSAGHKRDALVERFGERGFDYAGNARDDLPVWRAARYAIVVNPDTRLERDARALGNVSTVIRSHPWSWSRWLQALRPHQWLKNLLLFVPLLAAHRATEFALLAEGLLAFVAFGLCASSVYLLNDLLDLPDDRRHPTKRHRPLAAGELSLHHAVLSCPLLLLSAFAIALLWLPGAFAAALAAYYALTLAYSLVLKRFMGVDVIALATLYTLRVIAGGAAFGLELSFWLLAFSMFIFLSLALVKRHAELFRAREDGSMGRTPGRGYYPDDLGMIAPLGAAAGYLAVLVLALYINDLHAADLYRQPELIWLACPLLLYWISRVWMLAHRGEMHDDPVIFALRDRASLAVGVLCALVFWAAT